MAAVLAYHLPELQPTLALTLILSLLNAFKVSARPTWWQDAIRSRASICCSICSTTWFLSLDLPRLAAAAVLVALVLLVVILGLLNGGTTVRKMSRVHKPHRWQWLWLIPAALLVWWPLWFLFMGALMSQEELRLTIGPALGWAPDIPSGTCCQTGRRSNRC